MTSHLFNPDKMAPESSAGDSGPSGNFCESEYWDRFGHWLTRSRKRYRLSGCNLAAEVDIHRNTLHRYEMGEGGCSAYHHMRFKEVFARYEEINARRAGTAVNSGLSGR